MRRRAKQQYNMRLTQDYVDWVDKYAATKGSNRTEITEELFLALAEGRLYVAPPSGPNPFPAQDPLFRAPPDRKE